MACRTDRRLQFRTVDTFEIECAHQPRSLVRNVVDGSRANNRVWVLDDLRGSGCDERRLELIASVRAIHGQSFSPLVAEQDMMRAKRQVVHSDLMHPSSQVSE